MIRLFIKLPVQVSSKENIKTREDWEAFPCHKAIIHLSHGVAPHKANKEVQLMFLRYELSVVVLFK